MLAFVMNFTGSAITIWGVIQDIITASATCDYTTMAVKLGTLVRKLSNVLPILSEGRRPPPFSIESLPMY
jgi:hypothetical protein